MKINDLFQFIGFRSRLATKEFMELWEPYSSQLVHDPEGSCLMETVSAHRKSEFDFVSRLSCDEDSFRFSYMQGRERSKFPDNKAVVVQAGGYIISEMQHPGACDKSDSKILAFIAQGETDTGFFRQQPCRHMNIFEAYFENCRYAYIIEYFLRKQDAEALLTELNDRPGVEAAGYRECRPARSVPVRLRNLS